MVNGIRRGVGPLATGRAQRRLRARRVRHPLPPSALRVASSALAEAEKMPPPCRKYNVRPSLDHCGFQSLRRRPLRLDSAKPASCGRPLQIPYKIPPPPRPPPPASTAYRPAIRRRHHPSDGTDAPRQAAARDAPAHPIRSSPADRRSVPPRRFCCLPPRPPPKPPLPPTVTSAGASAWASVLMSRSFGSLSTGVNAML